MDISSTSNASYSRSVTPSKSSSDRQSNDEYQVSVSENKSEQSAQQQKAMQDNLQRDQEENQRRLDGRLITFGYEHADTNQRESSTSFNRSRVNEAYSPPQNDLTNSHKENINQSSKEEAIDIVV